MAVLIDDLCGGGLRRYFDFPGRATSPFVPVGPSQLG